MHAGDGMGSNRLKLQWERFALDIKKNLPTVRVVKHRDRLPGEAVGTPSPAISWK